MCVGCEDFNKLYSIFFVPCGKFGWPYPGINETRTQNASWLRSLLSFFFFFFFFFFNSHCPLPEIRVALPGKVQQPQEQRYLFLSVCAVFSCVQTMVRLPVFGGLKCAHILMHAIAHGGCTDTERESALKVDSGRKIPCRTGDSNPRQYCAWLFNRTN